MPKVTVVVPCFNASSYIKRCIDALSNQSYNDFDVILVDDCSTDDTYDCVSKLAEVAPVKMTVMKNDQNSGPSFSRRKAAMSCNSEYLAFCDSDDWYDLDFLSTAMDSIVHYPADMVISGYNTVVPSGRVFQHPVSSDKVYNAEKSLVFKTGVDSLCVMVVKRSVFLGVPHLDIRNGEDMAIIPPMIASSNGINILDNCSYNYFYHPGSASGAANEKVVLSLLQSFSHIKRHTPDQYFCEVEAAGIRIVLYGALLCLFKFSYDTRKAREIIDDFNRQYPHWRQNSSIKEMAITKRLFLTAVYFHCFPAMKMMSSIHKRFAN